MFPLSSLPLTDPVDIARAALAWPEGKPWPEPAVPKALPASTPRVIVINDGHRHIACQLGMK